MRKAHGLLLGALLATASTSGVIAQESMPDGDWQTINRDLAATRYSPLTDINKSNVGDLQEAWSYTLQAVNNAVPLVVNGNMYFSAGPRVVALNAATGEELWSHQGQQGAFSGRGVGYWPGSGDNAPRLLVTKGTELIALDAATGELVDSFGNGGAVTIDPGFGGTPTIHGNVAVIGAATLENQRGAPGNPRGFNVITGEKMWEFDTTPAHGELGGDTWGNSGADNRGGTNMWGFMATVDAETDTVYLPVAGPSHNYYGGDRPGANLFGNSIVAVDAQTGEYKWHFQTVHHDIWDVDMSHAGPLVPLANGGKAIANVGKSSLFYVLDSEDGEPVHAVEEMPVPRGDVPGEYYHPTQPIPQVTPPLSRVSMTFDDMVTAEDTNAAHAEACLNMWDAAGGYMNEGIFTPFMYRAEGSPLISTIQLQFGIGWFMF